MRYLASIILFLAITCNAIADLDVLVIGTTRSYANDEYSSIPRKQNPFNPQLVVDELQSILTNDAAIGEPVNVVFEDVYRTTTRNMFSSPYTVKCYSLLNYYYWPDGKTNRMDNLKGAAGTNWDHVVILGDPSFIASTPGVYAKGVKLVVDKVREGAAQPMLMMLWPHDGSSVPVDDFGEVAYRVGDSGGIPVAPAGYAWDALAGKDSGTHPTPNGAYLAAATLYSKMFDRNATNSNYTYDDAIADHAYSNVLAHSGQSHYSGNYSTEDSYHMLDEKSRVIKSDHGAGSSTEQGFRSWGQYNNDRYFNALLRPQISVSDYGDDPDYSGMTHFHIGRAFGGTKAYRVWTNSYKYAMGFPFQIRNQDSDTGDGGMDMLYGIDTLVGNRGDQLVAFHMISNGEVPKGIRNMPVHSIWATCKDELGITTPFIGDGNHYREEVNEAVVSYMMTLLTGRCPIGTNDTATMRIRRRIGYETAWIYSTLNIRPPGFTTHPSSYSAKTVTPGTSDSMSVDFVNPPQSNVTVNLAVDSSTAAIVNPKVLTFDAANHSDVQRVRVTGLPGGTASDAFNVSLQTTSSDMCFSNLLDSWAYETTRSATESLTPADQGDRQVSLVKNTSKIISLEVAGSSESNTTLGMPFDGVLTWSGSNVVYTPDTDYVGADSFAFAVNSGGTLTKGYVEITVTDLPAGSPVINNTDGATGITDTNALLHGWLTSTGGGPTTVTCYWNADSDPGTTTVGWDYSNAYGTAAGTGKYTNNTAETADLLPGTTYYYRYRAANSFATNWSLAVSFTTLAQPVVSNSSGGISVSDTAAVLPGQLTSGTSANAWICWGVSDAGTDGTSDWDNVISIGAVGQGVMFSNVVSSLATNTTYFYRCYAVNAIGEDWSDDAAAFSGTPVGGTGGWTPAEISTVAWFDADDASTIGLNGSLVTNWLDKSGNNNHASQSVVADQPTYTSSDSMVNNMPSIGDITASGSIGLDTASFGAKHVYVVTYYKDGVDSAFDDYSTLLSGPGGNGQYRVMGWLNKADLYNTSHFNNAGTYKNGATTSSLNGVLPMAASVFKFKANALRTQVYALGYNQLHDSRSSTPDLYQTHPRPD